MASNKSKENGFYVLETIEDRKMVSQRNNKEIKFTLKLSQ